MCTLMCAQRVVALDRVGIRAGIGRLLQAHCYLQHDVLKEEFGEYFQSDSDTYSQILTTLLAS
jgi:hypothetical protein